MIFKMRKNVKDRKNHCERKKIKLNVSDLTSYTANGTCRISFHNTFKAE